MSNRKQVYNDDNIVHGRVELKLIDAKTGRIKANRVGSNALSKANKVRVAHLAGKYLNDLNLSPMGKTVVTGADGFKHVTSTNSPVDRIVAADVNKQRCVVLLNNPTITDRYLDIFEVDGTLKLGSTVVGWFNSCTSGGSNPYLGVTVPNPPKQALRLNGAASEVRGWFETNKAIGTVTHVAVMPGFGDPVTGEAFYSGFANWTCLAKINQDSFIIPPGITGVTGEDEVLIYCPVDDAEFYKINLSTGAEIASTYKLSNLVGSTSFSAPGAFKVIDDTRLAYVNGTRIYIFTFNSDGVATMSYSGNVNNSGATLFTIDSDPGYLYCGYLNANSEATYRRINLTDYSEETITYADQTFLGGLPTKWTDESKILVAGNNGTEYYIWNTATDEMIVTDNRSDVCDSMTGTLTYPGTGFCLFNTSSVTYMYMSNPTNVQDQFFFNTYGKYDVTDQDALSSIANITANNMPFISACSFANYYNVYELSGTINKTASDTVDVSYADLADV